MPVNANGWREMSLTSNVKKPSPGAKRITNDYAKYDRVQKTGATIESNYQNCAKELSANS